MVILGLREASNFQSRFLKNLFSSLVLCLSAFSVLAEGDSVEDQIKAHCSALGRIAFLSVEKFKTGREIEEVKKELSAVVQSAATITNQGIFSKQFLDDYDAILKDVYEKKQRKATEYAVAYIEKCRQR